MKYLKIFESFMVTEEAKEYNALQIAKNIHKYHIANYTINEDGSIDVNGNVYLNNYVLNSLPLKFRNVSGDFVCSFNELTSLEGCPKSVRDNFWCRFNRLTSLEGCPKSIGGDFYCNDNKIITFEHLPLSIGGEFYCQDNPIYEVWKLFEDYSKIEFLNDCDAIREPDANSKEPIIILDRLNYFLEEIGKHTVIEVKGYKCI